VIILLLSQTTFSQLALQTNYAVDQKIYKLNKLQFQKLYQYQSIHDSLDLFTHFIKKVPIQQINFMDSLPFGHYLVIKVNGSQVNFKTYSKPFFKLQSHGYNGEVWHIITDQEDNVLKNVTVKIKDKTYPYQPSCNCYPIPVKQGYDTLQLAYLGHYDFYRVLANYNQQDPYEVKSNEYEKQVLSNVRILPGYVAFNQPKYRHSDTIRVKAFLVNEKGKPWRKRNVLVKYRTPDHKTVVLGKIKRQSEGAYVTDFVVPESFRLGTYQLSFWKTWDNLMLRSEPFQVEDYQLNRSNTYASSTTQQIYHRGQNVEFILKAQDVNGLPLLDAKAKITIQARHFIDFYDKVFYWNGKPNFYHFEKEVLFDVAGETVVSFHDSLFPNINMVYNATVTYSNDLGQLYTNNAINFTFDAKPHHFEFKLKGDRITVDYFKLGINTPSEQLQLISMRGNEIIETKTVSAPYNEKIDLFNTVYILKDKNRQEIGRLNFNNHSPLPVTLAGNRSHDSIAIRLNNDLQMPVSYRIFKRNKQIAGGQWQKGESQVIYAAADSTLDDYHVFYSVLWRGKHFIKEDIFYSDETKLNVEINQPDIVFPGSKIPIEVNITDYKNKGVEGANVTAYSVNGLFNDIPLPKLPYFGRLHHGFLNHFSVNQHHFNVNQNIALTEDLISQLDLRKTPYYDFAYPKNGVGVFQDSIGGSLSELAVYGKNMNDRLPIHAVYLNDEPVGINGSSNSSPFVFLKPAGTYELKLRTNKHLYTIKNVKLIAGEKTYLCLNESYIEGNPNVLYLKIDKPPFTKEEHDYFKSNFLMLKRSNHQLTIEQDGFIADTRNLTTNSIFYDNNQWYYLIGPLKQGKVNLYNQSTDTLVTNDFYPGYLYSVDSVGELIVDKPISDNFPSRGFKLTTRYQDWSFKYKLLRWADYLSSSEKPEIDYSSRTIQKKAPIVKINLDNPAREQQLQSFRPEKFGQANAGAVNLKNNTGKIMKWVLLVNQTDAKSTGAWYTSRFNYGGFTPGKYDIMVFFTDSSYSLLSDFIIQGNGTNYYRLDSNEIKAPDLATQLNYEEIIVAGNRSPLNTFVNYPLYFQKIHLKTLKSQKGQTLLSGYLVNSYNRPLNNQNLIFEKAGEFKYGALTNKDGFFELTDIEPGLYTIKIGNYLPYHVYADLTVKKGVNTRIVIGNDPVLRLNKEGELLEEELIPEAEEERVYHNGVNVRADEINNSPAYYADGEKSSMINAVPILLSSEGNISFRIPTNTYESTMYPNLAYEEDSKQNALEQYAKQKGLDKATMDLIRENDSLNRIRNNFRDYGYWVPNLVTDANGNARFTVEFPDNITRWKTIVPAMTGHKQTGIGVKYAQAYKPLSGHLGIPSFLIAGDSIQLEGKVLNYTNDAMAFKTWFKLNKDTLQTGFQSTERTLSETEWFSWSKPDSLTFGYGLAMKDGYLDGEERQLAVLTNGIKQVKAEIVLLDKDSILNISTDSTQKSVYIFNKPLGIYETEINRLKTYKYGCNEQTASKLKALLLEQKMAIALEKPFTEGKAIKTCIDILTRNQNQDGSFGWWGKSDYDLWVSAYVLNALNMASKTYKVDNYMATARLLKTRLSMMPVSDRLMVLNTLASVPFPMDYNSYIQGLDTINLSLQDEFQLIHLKQQQDSTVLIDKVLNSFKKAPEGIFWGEQLFNSYINKWQTSALAYKILRQAGGHEDLLSQMRDYFLQQNPEERNTIERATLLELFLEDELLANKTADQFKGEVWINNEKIKAFPYFKSFDINDSIHIRKAGTRVNVQVNTHTVIQNPHGNDSLLTVDTWFMQSGKHRDSLIAGTPTVYTVNVNVREDMNYVLLEIPIPASCIYNPKRARPNANESYRENFRYMTAISCASLTKGTHQFQIQLIPRYEGQFNALPVKVEEMYFPVNVNYSSAKKIVVEKR